MHVSNINRRGAIKRARLDKNNNIIVKFNGKDFKNILQNIKNLPTKDRSFIAASSEWRIVYKEEYVKLLHKLNFDISTDLYNKWQNTEYDDSWKKIVIPREYTKIMRPFQKETMQLLKFFKFRAMVGLPVGSGKSLIAMATIDWLEEFPVLIITTSSTTHNLKREYMKWINRGDIIFIPKTTEDLYDYKDRFDIVIVNYDKFNRQIDFVGKRKTPIPTKTLVEFKKNNFRVIITDEAQKYANENSKTYHSIKYLSEGVPYFLGMSATLLNNKTKELFNLCNILRPDIFKSRYSFLNRFCDPKTRFIGKGRKIRTFDGLSNEAELHSLLKNNMLIRFKPEEVMPELPPVVQSIIPMELDNYEEYCKIEEEFDNHAHTDENNVASGLQKMQALLKCSYENKINSCLNFVDDLLDNTNKVMIFLHNTEVMESVEKHYGKAMVKIDGTTSMNVRLQIVDKFVQDPSIKIFALNLVAGKEGIDGAQKICTHMCFFQHPFTSGGLIQAIGRLNRMNKIGITNVFHLVGRNTVDEKILEIIQTKQIMSDAVIDGEFNGKGATSSMYKELIKKYKETKNKSRVRRINEKIQN